MINTEAFRRPRWAQQELHCLLGTNWRNGDHVDSLCRRAGAATVGPARDINHNLRACSPAELLSKDPIVAKVLLFAHQVQSGSWSREIPLARRSLVELAAAAMVMRSVRSNAYQKAATTGCVNMLRSNTFSPGPRFRRQTTAPASTGSISRDGKFRQPTTGTRKPSGLRTPLSTENSQSRN